ncbi:hypothetical protein MN608_05711 [Microdochium nivale]|nr:hypothetical protein MN608_05711 [Microdochium nivale]
MLNSPIIADKQPRPPSRPAAAADTEAASHHSRTTSTAHRIQGMIDRMLRDTAAIGRQLERDSRELSRMSKLLAARSRQLEDCQSGIEDIIRPVVQGPTARDELESLVRAMDEWTRKNDQDRAANRMQDGLATEMSGKLGELELALHDSLWGQSESVASSVGLLDEMKNMRVIGAPDLFPPAAVSSDEQDSCGESAVVETAQVESYTKATGKVKKVVSFKADQCPETGKATAGIPDGVGTSSPTETSGKHKGRGKRRGGKRARRNKAGRNAKR